MVCLVEEKNRGDEREKEMKRILWLPVCHVCVYTILLHESLFGLREQNRENKEFYQFMTLDDNIAWVCLVAEKTEERNGNGIYEIFFLEFMIFSYLRPVWLRRELN